MPISLSGHVSEAGAPRAWRLQWPLFSMAAAWIADARAGDRVEYFSGNLAIDRAVGEGSSLPFRSAAMANAIANVFYAAGTEREPLVHLVQVRAAAGVCRYIAVRTQHDATAFVAKVMERAAPARLEVAA